MSRPLLIGVSARIYHPEGPVLDLGGVWTRTLHYLEQSVVHWVIARDVASKAKLQKLPSSAASL